MSPKPTATVPSRMATSNTTPPAAEGPPRVVVPADIDTAALTTRRGIDRAALTDSWRDW